MAKINSNLQHFFDNKYDQKRWEYLYHKYPQEYIRNRLRFLKKLLESRQMMSTLKNCKTDWKAAQKWLTDFKEGGLDQVCKPISRNLKQKLSPQDKQKLQEIILNKTPQDYEIDRYIWTGKTLEKLIYKEFGVNLKDSRIYEILAELGLSHQKAHRDYENADPEKQKEFQEIFKKKFKKPEN